MEILGAVQPKHILRENPSEIQSENNVVAKPLSPSHEETKPEKADNEAPTVHPDERPSKSEAQTKPEKAENEAPTVHPDERPSKSEAQTKPEKAENEAPTVHPDERPSKSEAQTTGEQVNSWPRTTTAFKPRKPFMSIESPQWLPKGWITELRIRTGGYSAGNADKLYYEPGTGRQFRSKNEVLSFLDTGTLPKRRSKTTSEGKDGDENKDLSGTPSEFDSSASNIDGTSLEAGKRHKGRPKMNPEREIGYETKDLSGKTSEFYSSASNVGGISLDARKRSKGRPKMNPRREAGGETKYLSGKASRFYTSISNIGGFFLETEKLNERRAKMNSDGQFRNETEGLSRTTFEINSGAINNGGISPYGATSPSLVSSPSHTMLSPISGSSDLLLHNNYSALPSNPFPIAPIVPQFIPTATPMSSFPNSVETDFRMYATRPILASSPSSSMLSSITGSSDLLVHNNHTALPSNPFRTVPIVPQSAPLISNFRDSVASQSTFASMISDTMTRHVAGNSDLLVHSNHTAFPSNPFPTVPIVPQSGTLISSFHDPVASQSTFASMMSDTYDLLFRNKHTARLPSYPRPMFGFTPELESVRFTTQLEAVSNANIPTALPSSRLHSSTILQSANNPDTISTGFDDLGRMPTKFQSLLDGTEGSKVHIFAEEKPTESSKKKMKPFIFTEEKPTGSSNKKRKPSIFTVEKPTGSSKKERKPSLDLNL